MGPEYEQPMMAQDRGRGVLYFLLLVVFGGICGLLYGSPTFPLAVAISAVVALVLIFNQPQIALYLILLMIIWSPEFGAEAEATVRDRPATVRGEDMALAALVLAWFFRFLKGGAYRIPRTPLNYPMLLYVSIAVLATVLGVVRGNVGVRLGFFFNLKFFQYFVFFFMTLAFVRTREQARQLVYFSVAVFATAVLYGYTQLGIGDRLYAPFDDQEPNTFGGYMLIMISLCVGMAMHHPSKNARFFFFLIPAICMIPFLYTKSRASYAGFIAAYFAFAAFAHRRSFFITLGLLVLVVMIGGYSILPSEIQERIGGTFEADPNPWAPRASLLGVEFDPSASARIISYGLALRVWSLQPLLGNGVTGTHFIDGQYFRTLAETGIFGIVAFLMIFARLIHSMRRIYDRTEDAFFKGLSLGMLCATFGLLGHALTANTFVIIRIAEPFWILTALVMLIPRFEGWHEITFERDEFIRMAREVPQSGPADREIFLGHPLDQY
jgi:hypothetical protein